jgi:hypothetical protein
VVSFISWTLYAWEKRLQHSLNRVDGLDVLERRKILSPAKKENTGVPLYLLIQYP